MKILIAEDDPLTGHLYAGALRKAGFQVEVAADGGIFLERFGRIQPDAVIVDIVMPGTNGIEVIKRLRAQPGMGQLPIIAVTNAFVEKLINDARQAGANV